MKRTITAVILFALTVAMLVFSTSCGVVGANLRLEGLTLGGVAMEGKPLTGLPSDKINLVLNVAAQTVKVHTSGNGTVLTILPSGATIQVNGDTVSFKGLKPDQVKVEWALAPTN